MSDTRWLISHSVSRQWLKTPQGPRTALLWCRDMWLTITIYFLFLVKHIRLLYAVLGFFCRRYCIQTKRLPGMHPLSAAQQCDPGPGGEGEDHTRSTTRLPRPLQQLRFPLSEQWSMCGENQRLFLQLCPVSLHRNVLSWRYKDCLCKKIHRLKIHWKRLKIVTLTSLDNTHGSSNWSFQRWKFTFLHLI